MPARSVLYLQPKPGQRAALIHAFRRLDVPGNALRQDGCLSVELQVPPDAEAPLLVTALWRRREDYDGWLANPWRAESSAVIEPLLAEEPAGVVYDIVLASGTPSAADLADDADRTTASSGAVHSGTTTADDAAPPAGPR